MLGGIVLLMCIFPAYALLTGPYTAKTRIAGVLGSVVGLIANLAQNLASSAKEIAFGGFKCRIALFGLAGVTFQHVRNLSKIIS